jgi:hypothetical protein
MPGPVEARQEPVAGDIDLLAAKPIELLANRFVMPLHEIPPASVAQPGGERSRTDDIGEQYGSQHPFRLGRLADTGHEFFDLGKHVVATQPRHMVVTRQFDVLSECLIIGWAGPGGRP